MLFAKQRRWMMMCAVVAFAGAMAGCGGATPKEPTVAEEVVAASDRTPDESSDMNPQTPAAVAEVTSNDSVATRSEDTAPTGTDVKSTIDRRGGEISLRNGAILRIPAGALDSAVHVTFGLGAQTPVLATNELRAVGPVLSIDPPMNAAAGLAFEISVPFVSIPSGYSADDLAFSVETPGAQRALDMGGVQTRWENYPAKHIGDRLVANVNALPGMRVAFVVTH